MWVYLVESLAWSLVGLVAGAVLAEAGWDIGTLIRSSGRRNHDDT